MSAAATLPAGVLLAPNFTLGEFVRSAKAQQLGIDNTPPPEVVLELQATAQVLQRVRDFLGHAVNITSGYRCGALNSAVGSRAKDHTTGHAADIVCPGYGTPYQVCKALAPRLAALGIGQLIYEVDDRGRRWVHISTKTPAKPANRVITISPHGPELGIQEV